MSDGALSAEEIDALLESSSEVDFGAGATPNAGFITRANVQAFQEIVNGTLGRQQSILAMLTGTEVAIRESATQFVTNAELANSVGPKPVEIRMDFSSGAPGAHAYLLSIDAAKRIAGSVMGQDDVGMNDAIINALQEVFAQVAEPMIDAIGKRIGQEIETGSGAARVVSDGLLQGSGDSVAAVRYRVAIGSETPFDLFEVFDRGIVDAVNRMATEPARMRAAPTGEARRAVSQPAPEDSLPGVRQVQFPIMQQLEKGNEQGNIGLLMDVDMEMTVELGRTHKLIKEILSIGEGTIIELNKLAGEPVDILVNHKLIAKGEVVVIDENFGVRVTEIVSAMERIGELS